jgi:sulfate permease, SulP family
VVTALTVVFVGVEQGILLAIALSLVDHTRHGYRPKNAVLVPDESDNWQPKPVATAAQAAPGLVIYRFTHSLYYANSPQFSDEVSLLASNTEPPLRWLCLDAGAVDDVDYSAAETLRSVHAKLKAKGIRLVVVHEMEELTTHAHHPLWELFGKDAFYGRLKDVVTLYRQKVQHSCSVQAPRSDPRELMESRGNIVAMTSHNGDP